MLIKYGSTIQKQKVIDMKVVFRMNLSESCTVDCLADSVAQVQILSSIRFRIRYLGCIIEGHPGSYRGHFE